MKKGIKRLMICMLVFVMCLSHSSMIKAYNSDSEDGNETEIPITVSDVDPSLVGVSKNLVEETSDEQESNYADDDLVRVSIVLNAPSLLDMGYLKNEDTDKKMSMAYRANLISVQKNVQTEIENKLDEQIEVVWNLTVSINAISAYVKYKDIKSIMDVDGVKTVTIECRYDTCFDNIDSFDTPVLNTAATSKYMVGATDLWEQGYTGAGMKIAIIDTGIDYNHQSFDEDAFNYAIREIENKKNGITEEIAEYTTIKGSDQFDHDPPVISFYKVDLFDQDDLSKAQSNLPLNSGNSAVFISNKIPYAYNYVDKNTNVTHLRDDESNHGSHVAGIAAANRYIKDSDGKYVEAISSVFAVGMAPDAQLFVMKVFGENGGAYDSDIASALDDAILLECDACNMSLGEIIPGFTYSPIYQSVYNKLVDSEYNTKMVLSVSAGNNESFLQAQSDNNRGLSTENINLQAGGSPGSLINSFTTGSFNNNRYLDGGIVLISGTGYTNAAYDTVIKFKDSYVRYYDFNEKYGRESFYSLAGDHEFVCIDSFGSVSDLETVNSAVSLAGKIVILKYESGTFTGEKIPAAEKANNLIEYSPLALIIVKDYCGSTTMGMNLDSFEGDFLVAGFYDRGISDVYWDENSQTVNNVDFVTGTLHIQEKGVIPLDIEDRENAVFNRQFSSYGCAGSLVLKPEISAPGGSIYSVYGATSETDNEDNYVSYGGTSMAAPHIAGLSSVLAQYIEENNISINGYSRRAIVQSLLMSTATPIIDNRSNQYYPVLAQGAGLVDVSKAASADSVIFIDQDSSTITALTGAAKDGKVKIELGDDPERKGEYTYSFRVYNISDHDVYYEAPYSEIFTQNYEYKYDKYGEIVGGPYLTLYCIEAGQQQSYVWNTYNSDGTVNSNSRFVPVGGYADVTVTFTFSVDNEVYTAGAYIEGYTFIKENTDDNVVHSIPILGFYGDWLDSPMFDYDNYLDVLYNGKSGKAYRSDDRITNYFTVRTDALSKSYIYSGNPYAFEEGFTIDKAAFNDKTVITGFNYTLIRGAGTIGYAVSERLDDGRFDTVIEANSVRGNEIEGSDAYYGNPITYAKGFGSLYEYPVKGVNGTHTIITNIKLGDLGLSSGNKYNLGLFAIPEYIAMKTNKHELNVYDDYTSVDSGYLTPADFSQWIEYNQFNRDNVLSIDFTYDTVKPVISELSVWTDDTGRILLRYDVSDDQSLAYLAILALGNDSPLFEVIPGNESYNGELDITDLFNEESIGDYVLFAGDYATNETAKLVSLNTNKELDVVVRDENGDRYFGTIQTGKTGISNMTKIEGLSNNEKVDSVIVQYNKDIYESYLITNDDTERMNIYSIDLTANSLYKMSDVDIQQLHSHNYNISFAASPYYYQVEGNSYLIGALENRIGMFSTSSGYEIDEWNISSSLGISFDKNIVFITPKNLNSKDLSTASLQQGQFIVEYYLMTDDGTIYDLRYIIDEYDPTILDWNGIFQVKKLMETGISYVDSLDGSMYYDGQAIYITEFSDGSSKLYRVIPEYETMTLVGEYDDFYITALFNKDTVPTVTPEKFKWDFVRWAWNKVSRNEVHAYVLYHCERLDKFSGYIEVPVTVIRHPSGFITKYIARISAEDSLDGIEHTSTYVDRYPIIIDDSRVKPISELIIKPVKKVIDDGVIETPVVGIKPDAMEEATKKTLVKMP